MSLGELDDVGVPTFRLSVSEDGVPTYDGWNAAAVALTNKTSEDIRGLSATEVFGGRFGRFANQKHRDVVAHGKRLEYRLTLPTTDGERVFHTVLQPRFTDGRVRWIYGTSVDVSAENAARRADALRLAALEEAERYVTMAAHDLRTPMRNVGILVEALKEDFEDHGDGKVELLDSLEQLSLRAGALISDVLGHARSVGTQPRPKEVFGLAEFAKDIFRVLDPLGIHELSVQSAEVETDRPTFQIILRNLLDNAVKHNGASPLSLTVSARAMEDMIALQVADNGKGFADPTLAFLNGGEFRYDSGFGLLGLRRLVEARGGRISVDDATGGGSVVEVLVPGTVGPVVGVRQMVRLDQEVMS